MVDRIRIVLALAVLVVTLVACENGGGAAGSAAPAAQSEAPVAQSAQPAVDSPQPSSSGGRYGY